MGRILRTRTPRILDTGEGRAGLQMLMLPLMPSLLRIPTCSMDTDWDTMVDTILTTMEDKQAEFKQNTTTTSSNSCQNKIKVETEVKTLVSTKRNIEIKCTK